ncbi:hypothetical protein [Paenibacillus spongiae]|uniref:Uncharacterized protein n=1 Tax=Paenibacillus spongiae TaxID=2909671 RepID=A0ABY5S1B3_9BACL|nr:hypothetical protein [Paenibacillus spongiae]UVI27647.1 hypothetical protein L1F29_19465 [Paenibacillus spongiae]
MPWNKSEKKENRGTESSIKDPAIALTPNKTGNRPPSLNGVNKQQS